MSTPKKVSDTPKRRPPAKTPEAREKQLIALTVDLAEKQLLEGTASSQVMTHFLKLASEKSRHENAILKEQKELLKAKTDALKSNKNIEALYANALKAMTTYAGKGTDEDYD